MKEGAYTGWTKMNEEKHKKEILFFLVFIASHHILTDPLFYTL